MGVHATRLSEGLGRDCINLGTLSFLDLPDYAYILDHYIRTNPGKVKTVILLCHPEALRRHGPKQVYVEFLKATYDERDYRPLDRRFEYLVNALGLYAFRDRVITRILPTPLPGAYGHFYGFTWDLYDYMSDNHGSIIDPTRRPFKGDPDYTVSSHVKTVSRIFKEVVPDDSKFIIGITPVPQSHVPAEFQEKRNELLQTWAQAIEPDHALLELPAFLPDDAFSTVTHLNENGAKVYTDLFIHAIKPNLPDYP